MAKQKMGRVIKNNQTLKSLQSQLKILEGEAEGLKIEVSTRQKEYSAKLNAIKSLKEQIDALQTTKEINVTEHAILRYLERVKGIDIKAIEEEILLSAKPYANTLGGTGKYPFKDNCRIVLTDYTVTTIV